MTFSEEYQHTRNKNGIYALIENNIVVYVGQSQNIYTRLLEHKVDNAKPFENVAIKIFEKPSIVSEFERIAEMGVICELKPKYNKIVFDNYTHWLYSLPSPTANIDKKMAVLINRVVCEIIEEMNIKGGIYGN